MRKKNILALISAAALALTLSACGGNPASALPVLEAPGAGQTSSATASGTETEARVKPDSSKYDDDITGLLTYMKDGQGIALDGEGVTFENGSVTIAESVTSFTQMSFKEIGAENGYRCQFSFNGSTIQAEFYAFDPENPDEKGKACISSVKEKGFFEVLGNEVPAVLHPSGKYVMVYTDAKAEKDENSAAQKDWATELFLSFKA